LQQNSDPFNKRIIRSPTSKESERVSPADAISLKEVYEAVEKPLVLMECLDKREPSCPYDGVCTQISVWDRAQSLLTNYLAGISLGSIADEGGLKSRVAGIRPPLFLSRGI